MVTGDNVPSDQTRELVFNYTCGAKQFGLHRDPLRSLDGPNSAVAVTSYDMNLELWSTEMTKPCPAPLPPTKPRLVLPHGACDTHVHVLGPYDKYPLNPARTYTAPEAPVDKLASFLDTMGCERVVIAHVTAHGTDMSVTLDAIRALGERARGIAILAPALTDAALKIHHDGGIRGALIAAGLRIALTPVDGEGLDIAAGEARAPLARMVCVAPSHQHPLGVVMSLRRRLALIEWARRRQACGRRGRGEHLPLGDRRHDPPLFRPLRQISDRRPAFPFEQSRRIDAPRIGYAASKRGCASPMRAL